MLNAIFTVAGVFESNFITRWQYDLKSSKNFYRAIYEFRLVTDANSTYIRRRWQKFLFKLLYQRLYLKPLFILHIRFLVSHSLFHSLKMEYKVCFTFRKIYETIREWVEKIFCSKWVNGINSLIKALCNSSTPSAWQMLSTF